MDYKMIEIYRHGEFIKNNWYEFIISEKWIQGWGRQFACGRKRPKFYEIKENGNTILYTSLHQSFYSTKRKLLNNK